MLDEVAQLRLAGEPEVAIVRGTVRDLDGTPVRGAAVAPDVPMAAVERAVTGADGRYELHLRLTNDSTHLIEARAPGYVAARSFAMTDSAGADGIVVVDFALAPLGSAKGVIAGYVQGWVGAAIMRFTDLMMAFPALLLAIALAAIFTPSLWIVAMVIALVNWVQIARVIYTETTALAAREYIEAARALGAAWPRILFLHILPHLIPTILVWATLGIATTVRSSVRTRVERRPISSTVPTWSP